MISYRHHIVSLVAVFLALAVGIVLGGGPLTDLGRAAEAPATRAPPPSAPPSRRSAPPGTATSSPPPAPPRCTAAG